MLENKDIGVFTTPLADERLGVKVQSLSRNKTKAMLALYLQHTDVYERIEQVDPSWTCEVTNQTVLGESVFVSMKMTIKGVTRENVGEGSDPKCAYSDALKRCAMLFGVGRWLYDQAMVWVDYNEERDRYKQWTVAEYYVALNRSSAKKTESKSKEEKKKDEKPKTPTREECIGEMLKLYKPFMMVFKGEIKQFLTDRYGVEEAKFLDVDQLVDLLEIMRKTIAQGVQKEAVNG